MRGNRRTNASDVPHLSSFSNHTLGSKARLFLTLFFVLASAGLFTLLQVTTHQAAQAAPTIIESTLPGSNFDPWGVNFDSSGNVWVADPQCDPNMQQVPLCAPTTGYLLKYSSQGFNSGSQPLQNVAEPQGYTSPFFLAFQGGNIWFAEPDSNAIGEYNPGNGSWNQWTVPTPNASPFDLVFDQYGHLWFTETSANKIGEFDPSTQQFQETPTPTANSRPYGIVGPDPTTHALWFTENNSTIHQIGGFIPASDGTIQNNTINEYHTNPPQGGGDTPHLITYDNSGNIWWAEGFDGDIARLVISQATPGTSNGVTEYAVPPASCVPSCQTHISAIGVDGNGTVWFDDADSARVGSFAPGSGTFTMYNVDVGDQFQLNAHPHDGLAIDYSGNVWFTEEFARKLGEVVQNINPPPSPSPTNTTTPSPSPTPPPGKIPVSQIWYFAEGKVGKGFLEWMTVENPDPNNACNINFDYLLTGKSPVNVARTVAKNSRYTESVNADLHITQNSSSEDLVSTIVTVTNPSSCSGVVVERPIYYLNFFGSSSGTDALGATHLNKTFYFADMPTITGIASFITILNPPGGSPADVKATYYAGGKVYGTPQTVNVPAGSRGTITPPRVSQRVAAIVTSDQPVVVERPTYFSNFPAGQAGNISGAASVVGVSSPSNEWLFAEGHVASGWQENLIIANLDPSNTANLTIKLEYPNGSIKTFTGPMAPETQANWDVSFHSSSGDVSIDITSTGAPIVVEREEFFRYGIGNGQTGTGMTDVNGMPGPAQATILSFAEGYTAPGFIEWLTLQNPTNNNEVAHVTLINGYGRTYTFTETVVAHSRLTVNINSYVLKYLYHSGDHSEGYEDSMFVQSTGPIVAERPQYFNASGSVGGSDVIGYIGN
jgi:hypothetical protein